MLMHGNIVISSLLYTFLSSTSVYDSKFQNHWLILGSKFNIHYRPPEEGFIPIITHSGHCLVPFSFTEDVSNRGHRYVQTMSSADEL